MRAHALLAAVVAVAVPLVLIGNGLVVGMQPWIIDAVYAVPGLPDDPLGLAGDDRERLAKLGVRSVRPFDDGVGLLRAARLPDGAPAFTARELRHMQDVRDLVGALLRVAAVALVAGVAAGLALRRRAGAAAVAVAVRRGALATLALGAVVGLGLLVAFDPVFDAFHGIFFEGRSWRFRDERTLRRLYPDAFWAIAGCLLAALVVLQAVVLARLPRPAARPGGGQRAPAS